MCPEWQSTSNTAIAYGNIIAYPAAKLLTQCIEYTANGYSCGQSIAMPEMPDASSLIVDGFWSTNAVDLSVGQPIARLLLNVAMLDMANQTMLIGKPA